MSDRGNGSDRGRGALGRARNGLRAAEGLLMTRGVDPADALPLLARTMDLLVEAAGTPVEADLEESRKSLFAAQARAASQEGPPLTRADVASLAVRMDFARRALERARRRRLGSWFARARAALGVAAPSIILVGLLGTVAVALVVSAGMPAAYEGLNGSYHVKPGRQGHWFQRVDHEIDFNWRQAAPFPGMPSDRFSVMWLGCIAIPEGSDTVLVAGADDRIRVVVDGKKVVDDWSVHGFRLKRGGDPIPAGIHDIDIEYEENTGEARVFLGWSRDGGDPVPVPHEYLVHKFGSPKYPCSR